MRFAHLKVQHGFERMRLRGLTGSRDEFHLAAIVQNLKTMALRLRGPPTDGVCASIAQVAWQFGCGVRRSGGDAQPAVSPKRFPNSKSQLREGIFRQHRPNSDIV
jgi:hypothetical protein